MGVSGKSHAVAVCRERRVLGYKGSMDRAVWKSGMDRAVWTERVVVAGVYRSPDNRAKGETNKQRLLAYLRGLPIAVDIWLTNLT